MNARLNVGVAGVGLLGPGFVNWSTGSHLLRNPELWLTSPTLLTPPARLPANERRRAGNVVKAAVLVADQACAMAQLDASTLATVFTSSTGDSANCHALCEALATPERLLSPTRFTNSVHNAAAGYWHIAVRSQQASTSLAAFDASVAAGLLEAAAQCVSTQRPVLLVAADQPYPAPLHALRPIADVFAFALVLLPQVEAQAQAQGAWLTLEMSIDQAATACTHAALEGLRQTMPAAQGLPLLTALAMRQAQTQQATGDSTELVLAGLGGSGLFVTCGAAP